jgi:hypothetical protein
MKRRRSASLLLVVLGVFSAGCSQGLEIRTGRTFEGRELPRPVWLDESLSRLCLTGLPDGSGDEDIPCALQTDAVGGGAVFDFSDDGRPDIIWTNPLFGSPVFLENQGGWRFRDVSEIIIGDADWRGAHGVAVGDIDNDGDGDIFFTRQGKDSSLLLVNQGGGHFIEEAGPRGVAMEDGSPHFGGSAVFGDYDGDGWLDLHTTEHRINELTPRERLGHARLFRNLGAEGKPGVFEDVTVGAGVDRRRAPEILVNFHSSFYDIDRDGWLDLHVVSNHNLSMLFLNNGDGTFRDGSPGYPLTDDESGMAVSVGDITGDGLADIVITGSSQTPTAVGETRTCADIRPVEVPLGSDMNTGNRLFVASDDGGYVDMTDRYGVRDGGWAWGAALVDFANTGRLGIVEVASRSMPTDSPFLYCMMSGTTLPVVRYWEQEETGELEEISGAAGIHGARRPKSPVTADIDGDGDEDLVIFESAGSPLLFENTTKGAGDRGITVSFGPENHPANAVMTVTFSDGSDPLVRIAGIGNTLYAARYAEEIIGLGDRAGIVANLRVEWPTGKTITVESPQPGKRIELP